MPPKKCNLKTDLVNIVSNCRLCCIQTSGPYFDMSSKFSSLKNHNHSAINTSHKVIKKFHMQKLIDR